MTENVEVPCPPPPPPAPPQNNNSSNDPGNGTKPNPGNNANNGGGNPGSGGGNGGSNPGGGNNGGHGGSGGGGGHSGNGPHASVVHGFKSTRRPASGCFESRVVPGYQHVQFHYDGDSFEIQLILSDPTSKAQLGTFLGYSYASDRVVDNMGVCETNHGR